MAVTVARIVSCADALAATLGTVQIPVVLLYVPTFGVADRNAKPAGNRSVTVTLVAAAGPRFDNVNVNAIAGVTRDFRGDATVKVKDHKEQLKVSRPFSHLFKQM